jgi:hypothetical protein
MISIQQKGRKSKWAKESRGPLRPGHRSDPPRLGVLFPREGLAQRRDVDLLHLPQRGEDALARTPA